MNETIFIVHQQDLFGDQETGYSVKKIDPREAAPFILKIHYAKRMPPISHAYGLIKKNQLHGVVTYGKPASRPLCVGVCGPEWSDKVIELNRLCLLNNLQNEASQLVGASLRLLPKPAIVVSYADTAQNHLGVIYQATNFIYTGTTTPRNEWYVQGLENTHARALGHLVDAKTDSVKIALQKQFGDKFQNRPRSVKHRYVYFVGSKTERKIMKNSLRYEAKPYPKKENK